MKPFAKGRALLPYLSETDPEIRVAALKALQRLDLESEVLKSIAKTAAKDAALAVRLEALRALGLYARENTAARRVAFQSLADANEDIRVLAIDILGHSHMRKDDPRAIDALIEMARGGSTNARRHALSWLASDPRPQPTNVFKEQIKILISNLKEPDLAEDAVVGLARLKGDPRFGTVVRSLDRRLVSNLEEATSEIDKVFVRTPIVIEPVRNCLVRALRKILPGRRSF